MNREFSDLERKIIAGYYKEDNLAHTNEISKPVTVSRTFYSKYIKRLIDILISGLILLVTIPINLIIAIITFFDVGRPIFFRQSRPGKDCKDFDIIKFRNMTNDTDENGVLLPPKERVTKWGKWVRKTSLDELLNFWSIFKGDMSLIGPRPLVRSYVDRYSDRHKMRHAIRPGLECPHISNVPVTGNKWQDQFENDVWYVEHVSFMTDIRMVIGLIKLVFNRKETASRGEAKRGAFMGYNKDGIAVNHTDIPEEYIERLERDKEKEEAKV